MNTKRYTIEDYLDILASKEAIPGGGGVAALNAALASSLACMVINLSLGKKKFAFIEEDLKAILLKMQNKYKIFLELADEDAKVFEPLSKAYILKVDTEEEKLNKEKILEPLLYEAALVPFKVIMEASDILKDLKFLAKKASRLAISDIGVASSNIKAAIYSAFLNVKINTKFMKDKDKAEELEKKALAIIENSNLLCDEIYDIVLGELNV